MLLVYVCTLIKNCIVIELPPQSAYMFRLENEHTLFLDITADRSRLKNLIIHSVMKYSRCWTS